MAVPTLLVDSNMRDGCLADMLKLPRCSRGLSKVLRRQVDERVAMVSNIVPSLSLLPVGASPHNPQELLSSGEFIALTLRLEKQFGAIIIRLRRGHGICRCRHRGHLDQNRRDRSPASTGPVSMRCMRLSSA